MLSTRGYGDCPCSGRFERRLVEVRMTVDGQVVTLENVPQGACPDCGSRVYKADVLRMIEQTMRGSRPLRATTRSSPPA